MADLSGSGSGKVVHRPRGAHLVGSVPLPLQDLRLRPGTEFYLGLVHMTDGVDGTLARIAAAQAFVADFGVATECGFGRRDPATIPCLLEVHSRVADTV